MSMLSTRVNQGELLGVKRGDCTAFFGIPYAKPPVGQLRFAPPQEPEAWEGQRSCDRRAVACCQMGHPEGSFYSKEFYSNPDYTPEKSEDCLYLDVWTPAEEPGEKMPVAFWIHGGAFIGGWSREIPFDGEGYCARGVILVSINYRVGPFGFFAHRDLTEASPDHTSGNYGILDQIAALKWVRENISAFGGDPEKITIIGQSAGSMSVQTLVSTELTKGMFRGAVMQSGGGYKTGMRRCTPLQEAEETGSALMEYMGVGSVEELRRVPAQELAQKGFFFSMERGGGSLIYCPNVDGRLLTADYDTLAQQGKIADVHYMIGSTLNDLGGNPDGDDKQGVLHQAAINWSQNLRELGRDPAWVYLFKRRLPGDDAGAWHSSELWYIFGSLDRCWRPWTQGDRDLSRRMGDAWANFVKNGSPSSPEDPWGPCGEDGYIMEFDVK